MRPIRTLSTLAVVVALAGLSACGSDDEPSSSGDPDSSTVAPTDADETDSATSDICTAVTDEEISGIVGGAVTREEVPGGGCNFTQEDPRAASVALNTTPFDEGTGGFQGAVSGVSGVLEGDAGEEVPGVGDEAYVKTGTMMGGESIKGAGVVHIGGILVQVTLLQAEGLAAPKVKSLVIDTLTLAADKA